MFPFDDVIMNNKYLVFNDSPKWPNGHSETTFIFLELCMTTSITFSQVLILKYVSSELVTQTHLGGHLCTYRYTLHWVVYSFTLGRSLPPPPPDIDRGDLPVKDDTSVDTLRDIWNPIKNFLWEWSKLIALLHTSVHRSLQILWNAFDGRLGTRCLDFFSFIEILSLQTSIVYISINYERDLCFMWLWIYHSYSCEQFCDIY